jgi:protein-disulfide isomerase
VLGSADAPRLIVSLNDYTCPHCRKMHEYLLAAQRRYGEQLGIVVLPMPLDSTCNPAIKETEPGHEHGCEYAKLALAVWCARPDKFAEFDRWIYAPARPPTVEAARKFAEDLVGADGLKRCQAEPWVDEQLKKDIELYVLLGRGVIPKVMVGEYLLEGRPSDESELFKVIEETLGVTPRGGR